MNKAVRTRRIASLWRLISRFSGLRRHVLQGVIFFGTLPYYRFYQFNTLNIITRVAHHNSHPGEYGTLHRLLVRWRERKAAELQFISVACAVLLGSVIGSFSWTTITEAYWFALACWYCSLWLSMLGILLAAQQMTVLAFLGEIPRRNEQARAAVRRYTNLMVLPTQTPTAPPRGGALELGMPGFRPRWIMVFVWQCPMMFMAYSICFFLLGLTLLVITPLIRLKEQGWTSGANVAIFYLVMAAVALGSFSFCSYWIYHYVDMETDVMADIDAVETRGLSSATIMRSPTDMSLQTQ